MASRRGMTLRWMTFDVDKGPRLAATESDVQCVCIGLDPPPLSPL
jgi:hypothetical protein